MLLNEDFLVKSSSSSPSPKSTRDQSDDVDTNAVINNPVIALICLVGLDLTGRFLVEHCTLPKSGSRMRHSPSATTVQNAQSHGSSHNPPPPSSSSSALPIDR